MKIFKFFVFFFLSLFFTVPVAAQGDILALMYHDFAFSEQSDGFSFDWSTSQEKFRSDILTLYELGYESLSLEDYADGKFDREKFYFILTFDDGYRSCYEVAFPVLVELEAKAAVFLNTDKISGAPERMTWDQLVEMEKSGLVEAYSHMPLHIDVTGMGIDEFSELVMKSCDMIEEKLGDKISRKTAFAYPYGLYNRETYDRLIEMGFRFQMVQDVEPDDINNKNFIIRSNVAYKTDIAELAEEHRQLNRDM